MEEEAKRDEAFVWVGAINLKNLGSGIRSPLQMKHRMAVPALTSQ